MNECTNEQMKKKKKTIIHLNLLDSLNEIIQINR